MTIDDDNDYTERERFTIISNGYGILRQDIEREILELLPKASNRYGVLAFKEYKEEFFLYAKPNKPVFMSSVTADEKIEGFTLVWQDTDFKYWDTAHIPIPVLINALEHAVEMIEFKQEMERRANKEF